MSSTAWCRSTAAIRFNVAGIADRLRVNISDVRDRAQHALSSSSDQDVPVQPGGPDQPSRLDGRSRTPTSRSTAAPSCRSSRRAAASTRPSRSCSRARARSTAVPSTCRSTRSTRSRPVDVNGDQQDRRRVVTTCSVQRRLRRARPAALRLTNTIGPRMRIKDARQTFLGVWVRSCTRGRARSRCGDGDQLRDLHLRRRRRRRVPARGRERCGANGACFNLGGLEADLAARSRATAGRRQRCGRVRGARSIPAERKRIDIGDYYAD